MSAVLALPALLPQPCKQPQPRNKPEQDRADGLGAAQAMSFPFHDVAGAQ